MSEAVLDIIARIRHLPASERLELEDLRAREAESEWQREAETGRRMSAERGLDGAAIDRAIEKASRGS